MKILCISLVITGVLFSASRWELLHYELTDNGFMDVSAVDSMNAWLVGIRDGVGGIIYKTQDGGVNWQEIQPWSIEEAFFTFSIQFLDLNTGYVTSIGIVFSLFPVACLLKTTDGGSTWNTIYGGDIGFLNRLWEDVFFVDYNNGWVVGYKSDILHTSDGGNNWDSQNAPDTSYSLKAVYFLNQNEGWIAGGDYDTLTGEGKNGVILHTVNGGNTWEVQIDSAPFQLWDVFFINSQKGWACGYKDSVSPGLILKTEDGGNTWNLIMAPEVSLGPYGIYGIEFIDEFTGFAAGAGSRWNTSGSYFAVFLKTNDGGNTWDVDTVIYENAPWGASPVCLDMASRNWGFAGGTRLSVFRYAPYTAIHENNFTYKNCVKVFPSRDGIYLDSREPVSLKILDISGRVLYKREFFKGEFFYPVKKQGIYYVLFKSGKKRCVEKIPLIIR